MILRNSVTSCLEFKIHHVNKWDCRPLSRRIIDPNKVRRLKEQLSAIEESKIASINNTVQEAKTPAEKKRATQAKSLLTNFLDDEPPPQESHFDEVKKERLARAAAQKKKFQEDLLARLIHVKHDHSYFLTESDASDTCVTEEKASAVQPHLVNKLYQNHVVLNFDQVKSWKQILEHNQIQKSGLMQESCGLQLPL